MSEASYYARLLEQVYQGRRWIMAFESLGAATELGDHLLKLGAQGLLPLCAGRGSGAILEPGVRCEEPIWLDLKPAESVMGGIHGFMEACAALPPQALARIESFDPAQQARVIAPFYDEGQPIAGRAKWGARPLTWQRLEDKTIIDAIWDQIGVARPPSQVVEATQRALMAAHRALDQGQGTVWSGDNRQGFNGGAELVRWIYDANSAQQATAFLGERCDHVRVAPFLEGIPCSVHGIVVDGYTIALRPCEMLVFRRLSPQHAGTFHYGSAATFWDPPAPQREQMRAMARQVGQWLFEHHQYRGAFTIDGVMTQAGFAPTELNPRFGAALRYVDRAVEELSLLLLNMALIEGVQADWRPEALERLLLEAADTHRGGRALIMTAKTIEAMTLHLVLDEDEPQEVEDQADAEMTVQMGPVSGGGHISVIFHAAKTPTGASVAPRALKAFAYLDERLQLELGELQPATDVHREGQAQG